MSIATIAAHEGRHVVTCDIGVAYLNASMPSNKRVLMKLSRDYAEILCWLKPEYRSFLCDDGTMIVHITKALYDCIESAKLWYENFAKTLTDDGFIPNPKDLCVFNKQVDGNQITICVHVDDLLVTSVNAEAIEAVISLLQQKYKDLVVNRGAVHHYLGMVFHFTVKGKCKITMPLFITETVRKSGVTGVAASPATENLFVVREETRKLNEQESERFHSLVASLQYLAKRVRPDILCPVVFLSTRVISSDVDDL